MPAAQRRFSLKLLLVLLSAAVYVYATYALQKNVKKVAKRSEGTLKLSGLLMVATLGRFAGWVLLGATVLATEPIIGWMLIMTRFPGAVLKGYAIMQKSTTRPSWRMVLCYVLPPALLLALLAILLATTALGPVMVGPLRIFVVFCFAANAYALYTEIRRIKRPEENTFGMMLIFQRAMLVNFIASFILGFFSADKGLGYLMIGVYFVVMIEQGYLVYLLEKGKREFREQQSKEK